MSKKIIVAIMFLSPFVFININCSKNVKQKDVELQNCSSIKVQLLLEDIFRKKRLFPYVYSFNDKDSSLRYNYLYSKNLNIPDKQFYLRLMQAGEESKNDSVRLINVLDTNIRRDANSVYVSLKETNSDTTNVKIHVSYWTTNNIASTMCSFTYSYDLNSCLWTVKDSTFWQY